MDAKLLEQLLNEEEGPTLDFKRDQYKFDGGSDHERSELLKDILGFANGWRRADAYILIGVDEVRGDRCSVVGTTDHLHDHTLQQFVSNRTNCPVQFVYEVCRIDEQQIGVIRIDLQTRPIYLIKDYGKLKKDKVYVRRGSSTDPTKPATLEEIARMGASVIASSPEAELDIEFADAKLDHPIGKQFSVSAERCDVPDFEDIPTVSNRVSHRRMFAVAQVRDTSIYRPLNESFYREMANYEFVNRLFRPVRFVVTNTGKVAANDVRLEIILQKSNGIGFFEPSAIPFQPLKRKFHFGIGLEATRNIRPVMKNAGDVSVEDNDERFKFEMNCGNIQPGRKIWSGNFFIRVAETGLFKIDGQFFAENLSQPKIFTLTIDAAITNTSMTVDELLRLADAKDGEDQKPHS